MPNDPKPRRTLEALEAEMNLLLDSYRLAPRTERMYDTHWTAFSKWCASVERCPLPADEQTLAAYVAEGVPSHYADGSVGTMLAAIAEHHRSAGFRPPNGDLARATRLGIANVEGQPAPRTGALTADLTERAALAAPATPVSALRPRALLLVGHAGKVAHTQLQHLERHGVTRDRHGLLLALPALTAYGPPLSARVVKVAATGGELCPVSAMEALLAATGGTRPLAGPTSVPRLRRAAAGAGVELTFDPYPAQGLEPADLWRLAVHVSRGSVVYLRDKAYLLLLHAGPFERSEPLRLRGADLVEDEDGLVIHLPWAKPDAFGRQECVRIPRGTDPAVCPVAAVAEWRRLKCLGADDWLFPPMGGDGTHPMDGCTAWAGVRRLTRRAGLGPVPPGDVRRGFFVSAHEAGESVLSITMATRVKRLETTRAVLGSAPPTRRAAPRALGM